MPRNFKRKYKHLRLQATESVDIVKKLIGMLSQYGYDLTFPTDVIQIIGDLAAKQHGPEASPDQQPAHDDNAFRRLAEFADEEIQLSFVVVEEGMTEEGGEEGVADLIEEDTMPNSLEEMQRAFEVKNAVLMARLETNGVRTTDPRNPANGKKMGLDKDAAKRLGIPMAPQRSEGVAHKNDMDEMMRSLEIDNTSKPTLPASEQRSGGKRNPQTGLSPEEARALIAKATGKMPRPPAGNPVMKPP